MKKNKNITLLKPEPKQKTEMVEILDSLFPVTDMVSVKSSNILLAHFIKGSGREGCLYLKFHNGKYYRYDGVTSAMYAHMMASESIGKFFFANIRDKFTTSEVFTTLEEAQG